MNQDIDNFISELDGICRVINSYVEQATKVRNVLNSLMLSLGACDYLACRNIGVAKENIQYTIESTKRVQEAVNKFADIVTGLE